MVFSINIVSSNFQVAKVMASGLLATSTATESTSFYTTTSTFDESLVVAPLLLDEELNLSHQHMEVELVGLTVIKLRTLTHSFGAPLHPVPVPESSNPFHVHRNDRHRIPLQYAKGTLSDGYISWYIMVHQRRNAICIYLSGHNHVS